MKTWTTILVETRSNERSGKAYKPRDGRPDDNTIKEMQDIEIPMRMNMRLEFNQDGDCNVSTLGGPQFCGF